MLVLGQKGRNNLCTNTTSVLRGPTGIFTFLLNLEMLVSHQFAVHIKKKNGDAEINFLLSAHVLARQYHFANSTHPFF